MRGFGILSVVTCVTTTPAAAQLTQAAGGSVTGQIVIKEKHNKPSRDIGNAVVYLEGPGAAAKAATVDVTISDKKFVPDVIVIPAGTTVRFPNTDPFNHNVFSVSDPNGFDLGLYGRGEAGRHTFEHAGLVQVFCNVHPTMVAYVQVMANRWYAQPSTDGTYHIDRVPPGHYTLHLWHARVPAEVVRDIVVGPTGLARTVPDTLDASGYKWQPHKNKFGKAYPTNAGRELY
ncbi:MAG TPA: plastocyanin/azurin family copper-binding protein [Gemmatimonadales bacterium]